MDDYCMVLWMEFFDQVHSFSFEDQTMHITQDSTIHTIPLEKIKTKSRILSSMQPKKGLNKG